jgi:hypothetical protein
LKLAEYEFETQHNSGKSYVNADVLSRNIASVSAKNKKEKEEISANDLEVVLTREVPYKEEVVSYCQESLRY